MTISYTETKARYLEALVNNKEERRQYVVN